MCFSAICTLFKFLSALYVEPYQPFSHIYAPFESIFFRTANDKHKKLYARTMLNFLLINS